MPREITIEIDDDDNLNTHSSFDLGTTLVIIEKVKQQLVKRAQIRRKEGAEEAEEEEE